MEMKIELRDKKKPTSSLFWKLGRYYGLDILGGDNYAESEIGSSCSWEERSCNSCWLWQVVEILIWSHLSPPLICHMINVVCWFQIRYKSHNTVLSFLPPPPSSPLLPAMAGPICEHIRKPLTGPNTDEGTQTMICPFRFQVFVFSLSFFYVY